MESDDELAEVHEPTDDELAVQTALFPALRHPLRTAIRMRLGQKLVDGGIALLPGLAVAGGMTWIGLRAIRAIKARIAAFKNRGMGDTTIQVNVKPLRSAGPTVEGAARPVEKKPAPAPARPPAPPSRPALRARLLRPRGGG
jgi:hypothetical protein